MNFMLVMRLYRTPKKSKTNIIFGIGSSFTNQKNICLKVIYLRIAVLKFGNIVLDTNFVQSLKFETKNVFFAELCIDKSTQFHFSVFVSLQLFSTTTKFRDDAVELCLSLVMSMKLFDFNIILL